MEKRYSLSVSSFSIIITSVHDYPESIDPEKRKRMLLLLDLENMSKKVIVSEEALVYDCSSRVWERLQENSAVFRRKRCYSAIIRSICFK